MIIEGGNGEMTVDVYVSQDTSILLEIGPGKVLCGSSFRSSNDGSFLKRPGTTNESC